MTKRMNEKEHMNPTNCFATLLEPLRRAVAEEGYTTPTPIQALAIPDILQGRDILGCAQTGTGKTAAFILPLLQGLIQHPRPTQPHRPRALILTPTRELAAQIGASIKAYGRHIRVTHAVIFGGVGQEPQERVMRKGTDIVVATPGRLLDLMEQRHVLLDAVEVFVLDEADRMLDMGFIPAVRRIIAKLPRRRHSLFFSATMPPVVARLAHELLHNPVQVTVDPEQPTVERIAQSVLFVDKGDKDALLLSLLQSRNMDKVIVFTRTKHGADRVVRALSGARILSSAIHGNKSQGARTNALQGFKAGHVRVLVATDIAARGIDVDAITHVVNYDLPQDAESYVHRIGRTARAGTEGDAISFCCARERDALRSIETLIRKPVPVVSEHRWHSEAARLATGAEARPEPRGQRPARRPARASSAMGRRNQSVRRGHARKSSQG